MALTQRLEFRQSQALVMTPQLMQAIKLLQLSNLDLAAYVEGELERNPAAGAHERRARRGRPACRGRRARRGDTSGEAAEGEWAKSDVNGSRGHRGLASTPRSRTSFPTAAEAPARPAQSEPAAYSEWAGVGSGGREDGDYNLEAFVSAETTLADHLGEQLSLAIADPVRRLIGRHLIDLVDEAGYLTGDLEAVAEKLGAPLAEVERCSRCCRASIRPACARATSSECLRSSSRSATASIRRCRRCSRISISLARRDLARCAASAASTMRISPT